MFNYFNGEFFVADVNGDGEAMVMIEHPQVLGVPALTLRGHDKEALMQQAREWVETSRANDLARWERAAAAAGVPISYERLPYRAVLTYRIELVYWYQRPRWQGVDPYAGWHTGAKCRSEAFEL